MIVTVSLAVKKISGLITSTAYVPDAALSISNVSRVLVVV